MCYTLMTVIMGYSNALFVMLRLSAGGFVAYLILGLLLAMCIRIIVTSWKEYGGKEDTK